MKQRIFMMTRGLAATVLTAVLAFGLGSAANAAPNQGTGDIAGDTNALVDSNVFNLLSTGSALTLVKVAFLADGTPLASGSTVPTGTTVKFMIYVNNSASIPINDVSVQDVLDPLFLYAGPDTVQVDNSVANCAAVACTPAEEAAIFAAVNGAATSTDATGDDSASVTGGTTVDVGNQVQATNAQQNVAANTVLAVLITAVVQ